MKTWQFVSIFVLAILSLISLISQTLYNLCPCTNMCSSEFTLAYVNPWVFGITLLVFIASSVRIVMEYP
jgi:hypothetical protein